MGDEWGQGAVLVFVSQTRKEAKSRQNETNVDVSFQLSFRRGIRVGLIVPITIMWYLFDSLPSYVIHCDRKA